MPINDQSFGNVFVENNKENKEKKKNEQKENENKSE